MGYRERAIDIHGLLFIIGCFISWKAALTVILSLAIFLLISFWVEDSEKKKRVRINEKNRLRLMVRSIEKERA